MAASSSASAAARRVVSRASSAATSWTARTCLHGPRSPRWRPYQGTYSASRPPSSERDTRPRRARPPSRRWPGRRSSRSERHPLDEPARVAEAWLEALDAPEVERQLAPEEPAVGEVVADDPGQRERGKRARDLVARPPGRGRQGVDPEPRLPAERAAHRGDGRRWRGVGQAMERTALAGEPTPDLGAEHERQSSARNVELPAGAAVAGRARRRAAPSRDGRRGRTGAGGPDRPGRRAPRPGSWWNVRRPRPAGATQTGRFDGDFGIDRRKARVPRRRARRPARARPGSPGPRGSRAASATAAGPAARPRTPRPSRPPRRPRPTDEAQGGPDPGRRPARSGSRARSRRWSSLARASRRRTPRAAGRPARRRCSRPRTPRTAGGRRRTSPRDRRARGSA